MSQNDSVVEVWYLASICYLNTEAFDACKEATEKGLQLLAKAAGDKEIALQFIEIEQEMERLKAEKGQT